MNMSYNTHVSSASLINSEMLARHNCNLITPHIVLQNYQACPLCSHDQAFHDWSGYRDAFVSLSTRSFNCPICLSSIQGVEKFALHLVSHDLRAKMSGLASSTSIENNISTNSSNTISTSSVYPTPLFLNNQAVNQNKIIRNVPSATNGRHSDVNRNVGAEGILRPNSSKLLNGQDTRTTSQTQQNLIKDEVNLDDAEIPSIEKSSVPNETRESLDELLDDYSEFVQQQECNKANNLAILGMKKEEIPTRSNNSSISIQSTELKHNQNEPTPMTQFESQVHFNNVASTNFTNTINSRNRLSTQPDQLRASGNIPDIRKNIDTFGLIDQKDDIPLNSKDNVALSSLQPDIFFPPNPTRKEKQVTINVQVPKPLYHKYFTPSSKVSEDYFNKNMVAYQEESNQNAETEQLLQQKVVSDGYGSNSNSILHAETLTGQMINNPTFLYGNIAPKDVAEMDVGVSQSIMNTTHDGFLASPEHQQINGPVTPNSLLVQANSVASTDIDSLGPLSDIKSTYTQAIDKIDETLSPSQASVKCLLCGWNFDNENFLQLHTVLMHSPHRKRGSQAAMTQGVQSRCGVGKQKQVLESFHCRECNGQTFKHHEEYVQHLKLVHNDHRYVCNICAKKFKLRGSLLVHVRVVHNPFDDTETDYHCRTCNRKFSSRHRRDIHEKKHDELNHKPFEDLTRKILLEGKVEANSNSNNRGVSSQNFPPNSIDSSTNSNQFIDVIPSTNTGYESKNTIDLQKLAAFNVRNQITQNESLTTKDINPKENMNAITATFSPALTPDPSSPPTNVLKHPESINSTDHIYKCNQCDKVFKRQTHLHQHSLTHELRQWDCDVCKKTFTTKYFLKKHKRLHTGKSIELLRNHIY